MHGRIGVSVHAHVVVGLPHECDHTFVLVLLMSKRRRVISIRVPGQPGRNGQHVQPLVAVDPPIATVITRVLVKMRNKQ